MQSVTANESRINDFTMGSAGPNIPRRGRFVRVKHAGRECVAKGFENGSHPIGVDIEEDGAGGRRGSVGDDAEDGVVERGLVGLFGVELRGLNALAGKARRKRGGTVTSAERPLPEEREGPARTRGEREMERGASD